MQTLNVNLGDRSYEILFGDRSLDKIGDACRNIKLSGQAMIVTNSRINALYGEEVKNSLRKAGYRVETLEIPDGEEFKNITTLKRIYDVLISSGLDRGSFLVALGGGVIGDITGFAAATYLRGISFVQVPTTLLAQVDSSVGGKTGINHEKGKNLIGAFHQPSLVYIDVNTLASLPRREYVSGLAEVVKYGIINDRTFFDFIFDNAAKLLERDTECLLQVEKRCCEIKASVVLQDEKESGLRVILNYGHTIGHAIESLTGYTTYLHGEAVAIGMAQAAKISETLGLATHEDTKKIVALLRMLTLPVTMPTFSAKQYADVMHRDKKIKNGRIKFVLNSGIGEYSVVEIKDLDLILKNSGLVDANE